MAEKETSTAKNFENLMQSNPVQALKYIKEFKETAFWKYYKANMDATQEELIALLCTCEIKDVKQIRAGREAYADMCNFPNQVIEQLNDDIALQKEAAKIEAARTPVKEDDWLKPMKINRA